MLKTISQPKTERVMKLELAEKWNIKLKVTAKERRKIQKDAIDLDLRIGEYVKLKLLGDLPIPKEKLEEKSA